MNGREKVEHKDERTHITSDSNPREQVERTADRIRDELLLTLEELDRRRDRALDVRFQASRHKDLIIGAAATVIGLVGVSVGMAVWRSRHRDQRMVKKRRNALKRAWQHPDRLASKAEQRPLAVELGRRLILIFGSTLASAVAKNSIQALLPARQASTAPAGA